MNCRDIDAYLAADFPAGLPPRVLEHLSGCESCRRLYDSLHATPPLDEALSKNITVNSAILADLNAVKPLPSDSTLLMVCMVCAALVGIAGIVTWGVAGWDAQTPAMRILVFFSILLGLVASGIGMIVEMTPASRRPAYTDAVLLCSFALFAATVAVAFHRVYDIDPLRAGIDCFLRGIATAGVTALVVIIALRRGVWFNRLASSMGVALFCASVALLVLTLYCPVLAMSHVFMSHLGSIGTVLLVGWLIGSWLRGRT
jgi:hypothetical protein